MRYLIKFLIFSLLFININVLAQNTKKQTIINGKKVLEFGSPQRKVSIDRYKKYIKSDNDKTVFKVYWSRGYVNKITPRLNYKRHGLHTTFYRNGTKVNTLTFYRNGKRHGLQKKLSISGKILKLTRWKNGQKHGVEKRFSYKGKLINLTNWVKGLKQGQEIRYFNSGEIMLKKLYNKNKIIGTARTYYKNGKLSSKAPYKNGKRHGYFIYYYKNGRVNFKQRYKNGKRQGPALSYYQNGRLSGKKNYVNGKASGYALTYHKNGRVKSKLKYVNGKPVGWNIVFYPNGRVSTKYLFKDGKINGPYLTYYPNGAIKSKGIMKNYRYTGAILFYDGRNRVIFKQEYNKQGRMKNKVYWNLSSLLKAGKEALNKKASIITTEIKFYKSRIIFNSRGKKKPVFVISISPAARQLIALKLRERKIYSEIMFQGYRVSFVVSKINQNRVYGILLDFKALIGGK